MGWPCHRRPCHRRPPCTRRSCTWVPLRISGTREGGWTWSFASCGSSRSSMFFTGFLIRAPWIRATWDFRYYILGDRLLEQETRNLWLVGLYLICSCCEYAYLVATCSNLFCCKTRHQHCPRKKHLFWLVFAVMNMICCSSPSRFVIVVPFHCHCYWHLPWWNQIRFELNAMMIIIAIAMTRHLISVRILILRPPLNNLTWTWHDLAATFEYFELGCSKINTNSIPIRSSHVPSGKLPGQTRSQHSKQKT